jgi:hypothetical protein
VSEADLEECFGHKLNQEKKSAYYADLWGDLASILDHHARSRTGPDRRAGEDHSLAQGTASWAPLGTAEGEVTA